MPPVSKMTYTVSSGTLNPSIPVPYHAINQSMINYGNPNSVYIRYMYIQIMPPTLMVSKWRFLHWCRARLVQHVRCQVHQCLECDRTRQKTRADCRSSDVDSTRRTSRVVAAELSPVSHGISCLPMTASESCCYQAVPCTLPPDIHAHTHHFNDHFSR